MSAIKEIMKFQTTRGLDEQPYDWDNEGVNILEELFEARGYLLLKEHRSLLAEQLKKMRALLYAEPTIGWIAPTDNDKADAFADIIVFCVGALMKLGYNPEKVLSEVAKEINSREGVMIGGKFQKDPRQDPATLYKANFEGCKL